MSCMIARRVQRRQSSLCRFISDEEEEEEGSVRKRVLYKWVIGQAERAAKGCNVCLSEKEQSERSIMLKVGREMILNQPESMQVCGSMAEEKSAVMDVCEGMDLRVHRDMMTSW